MKPHAKQLTEHSRNLRRRRENKRRTVRTERHRANRNPQVIPAYRHFCGYDD